MKVMSAKPWGLAVDSADNWLVADGDPCNRVQVFTRQGDFVTEFGGFFDTLSVSVDLYGRILVGDREGKVHVFAF